MSARMHRILFWPPASACPSGNAYDVGMHYLPPFLDWDKTGRAESSAPSSCFADAHQIVSLGGYSAALRRDNVQRTESTKGAKNSRVTPKLIFVVSVVSVVFVV